MTPPTWTKTGYAYDQVRRRIMTGDLPSGTILPLNRLAQEFDISMTPLREALRRLDAEGLVVIDAHRDARVTRLSAEEATHLFELREQLDPMAAKLAANRRTDEDIEAIRTALEAMHPLEDENDLDGLTIHREFHRTIYHASHNPLLIQTLEGLWDKADRYRQVGIAARQDDESDRVRVEHEHAQIADSVISADPDGAESWMRTHVRRSLGRRAIDVLAAD